MNLRAIVKCHAVLFLPLLASGVEPVPQAFIQEVAVARTNGLPRAEIRLLDCGTDGIPRIMTGDGRWLEFRSGNWGECVTPDNEKGRLLFTDFQNQWCKAQVNPSGLIQIARCSQATYLAYSNSIYRVSGGTQEALDWPKSRRIAQIAASANDQLFVASDSGLFTGSRAGFERLLAMDSKGRDWAAGAVLGVSTTVPGDLWIATKAGAGKRNGGTWRFFEGTDGLPYNDFTWVAAGRDDSVWFGTHLGAIRFDGKEWYYRQGRGWMLDDDVLSVCVDGRGNPWFLTRKGLCSIEFRKLTLGNKADFFEEQIERYVKRTPYGFVAEAPLTRFGDLGSAAPQDSDNDGLWTAMYGAGECFGYAATGQAEFLTRAQKAFNALRFLQKVTQGGPYSPPAGYIARTIRPVEWPDPNAGRLAQDREGQKSDRLWKAYEPRWPKSADGKWYWKSDTSSDELDGHYFFYPLYFEFCAKTEEERERVRDVVRGITDHLITHDYALVDHDGTPTRWGVYGPTKLNTDPDWWQERGLKSLSTLSYLAVAAYITGDTKYERASRELIEKHGYAHNAMHSKVQHGPGSGNQSDDEMAFMCFYTLLRYSKDSALKDLIRVSFYRHWMNEAPEMNPFFNFAYAGLCLDAKGKSPWGEFSLKPWNDWQEDSVRTLRGFPLDRLNWARKNSHRLDIVYLPREKSSDFSEADRVKSRGYRQNGKVLAVENRHFNHWNTDPWDLDYGGNGNELAAGTVYLLPYYMGLYHGFIEKR